MTNALRINGRAVTPVGPVRIYVCGITPYAVTHLGHASTFLWTDLAARVLRSSGHQVVLARNITDVDEAMFAESARTGQHYDRLAAIQRFAFDSTMSALRIRTPDHQPTARAAIGHVIALAEALLARGHAYEVQGTVYARTSIAAQRSDLADDVAVALAHEYGDDPKSPEKESPLDTAVWRRADPDTVHWISPWGAGRPGWHAECAAMVLATFGPGIDLHAGGADLRFPHHAVESLLAEQATGVAPFARAWLQPGVVHIGGAKMAKSSGNLVMVDDLLETHDQAAIRMLCLHRRWAADWDFDPAELTRAAGLVEQLYAAAGRPGGEGGVAAVHDALLDDLDVPAALAEALDVGGAAARHLVAILLS